MLTLRCPSESRVDAYVRRVSGLPCLDDAGLLDRTTRVRYRRTRVGSLLGTGTDTYVLAVDALARWAPLELGWFRVHRPESTPVERGAIVAFSVRVMGLWFTWACRITSVSDTTTMAGDRSFTVRWAPIIGHGVRGEEEFALHYTAGTDEVRAEVAAVSRPARWFVWLGLPLARSMQRTFPSEMLAGWARSVRRAHPGGVTRGLTP